MKRLILIMILAAGWLNSRAEINCIAVYDTNDAVNIIPIADASEISFENNLIHIGKYSFNMELLKRYEFADASMVGIEEISGDISGLKIDTSGLITLEAGLSNAQVRVVDLSGVMQPFVKTGNVVDITNLPADVYIVTIGGTTLKILKR